MLDKTVIAWWSGGADSAVTCYMCLKQYKKVRVVFIDTENEHEDTYRFKKDCESWYGMKIETIKTNKWDSIEDVWEHYLSLNTATGAICSTELKRYVRIEFQKRNEYDLQAFGYDFCKREIKRAKQMAKNNPSAKPIFPLIDLKISKSKSLKILKENGIDIPIAYKLGYSNNNCLNTGCVKGGIGYWQKYKLDFPEKFREMAERERMYSKQKGEPVTICKDQSKNGGLVFLEHNPDYPEMKDISMIEGRKPENLMECNGFCQIQLNL